MSRTERDSQPDRIANTSGSSAEGEAVVGPEFYSSSPGTAFRARCGFCHQIVRYRDSDDIDRHIGRCTRGLPV